MGFFKLSLAGASEDEGILSLLVVLKSLGLGSFAECVVGCVGDDFQVFLAQHCHAPKGGVLGEKEPFCISQISQLLTGFSGAGWQLTHIKIIIFKENILVPGFAHYTVPSVPVLMARPCQYSLCGSSTIQ